MRIDNDQFQDEQLSKQSTEPNMPSLTWRLPVPSQLLWVISVVVHTGQPTWQTHETVSQTRRCVNQFEIQVNH